MLSLQWLATPPSLGRCVMSRETRKVRWCGHWFFPHERWLIPKIWRRHEANIANQGVARELNQKYGPEGRLVYSALLAGYLLAVFIGLSGLALLILSMGREPMEAIGYSFLYLGIAFGGLGIVRLWQAENIGRRFREERGRTGRSPG